MTDKTQILALNAFDPAAAVGLGPKLAESVRQRVKLFGAASVLFYDRPWNFIRGEGCRLYDADGMAYLDAYNNVPSVGHCHPYVAEAAARQLHELNIHNRYLHQGIIEYAERLTTRINWSRRWMRRWRRLTARGFGTRKLGSRRLSPRRNPVPPYS